MAVRKIPLGQSVPAREDKQTVNPSEDRNDAYISALNNITSSLFSYASNDGHPTVLVDIYEEEVNEDVQQLTAGDVALQKDEGWEGNEGAELVRRSPILGQNECRLLLTLDFS